jgi:hypothetical protein
MVLELQHFLQHDYCAYKYTQVNLVIKSLHFVRYLKFSQEEEKDKIENNVLCFDNCVNFCGQRLASTYVFMHLPLPLVFRRFLQIYMGKLDRNIS